MRGRNNKRRTILQYPFNEQRRRQARRACRTVLTVAGMCAVACSGVRGEDPS